MLHQIFCPTFLPISTAIHTMTPPQVQKQIPQLTDTHKDETQLCNLHQAFISTMPSNWLCFTEVQQVSEII